MEKIQIINGTIFVKMENGEKDNKITKALRDFNLNLDLYLKILEAKKSNK